MNLRTSYTLIAPFYDALIARATASARARSLAWLQPLPQNDVLISGIGTGLDLALAPQQHRYVGIDLTRAMLDKIPVHGNLTRVQSDSQRLPFVDDAFDHAVLHLILAVVPDGPRCLTEAARVVKPGGSLLILDKFLQRGTFAPLRRLLTPLSSRVATRLDVVFEDLLAGVPVLRTASDEPAMLNGWFRIIRLEKRTLHPGRVNTP